jgi:hypothetical protein
MITLKSFGRYNALRVRAFHFSHVNDKPQVEGKEEEAEKKRTKENLFELEL